MVDPITFAIPVVQSVLAKLITMAFTSNQRRPPVATEHDIRAEVRRQLDAAGRRDDRIEDLVLGSSLTEARRVSVSLDELTVTKRNRLEYRLDPATPRTEGSLQERLEALRSALTAGGSFASGDTEPSQYEEEPDTPHTGGSPPPEDAWEISLDEESPKATAPIHPQSPQSGLPTREQGDEWLSRLRRNIHRGHEG